MNMNVNSTLKMESLPNFKDSDWTSEDPVNKEYFYVKDSILYKEQNLKLLKSRQEELNKNNINNLIQPHIKFSSLLSGRNAIITHGGTVATLGRANQEEFVVVGGVKPQGTVYLEFICPISCHGLLFGMVSLNKAVF